MNKNRSLTDKAKDAVITKQSQAIKELKKRCREQERSLSNLKARIDNAEYELARSVPTSQHIELKRKHDTLVAEHEENTFRRWFKKLFKS